MPLSIISLFSGFGGLDLGVEMALHAAGIPAETVAQCEFAKFPRQVLAKHWPHADRHKDVTMLPALIRERRQRNRGPWRDRGADILIGGFPCQDISVAGAGAGLAGKRSGLFFDLIRVVRLLRPRVVMLENVAAAPARVGATVVGSLTALGYESAWTIISAADVGAPHLRERWFCVAWLPGCRGLVNANCTGLEKHQPRRRDEYKTAQRAGGRNGRAGEARAAQSRVGRDADGIPARLEQAVMPWPAPKGAPQYDFESARMVIGPPMPHRRQRIKGLGNAVSPPQAAAAAHWGLIPALELSGLTAAYAGARGDD